MGSSARGLDSYHREIERYGGDDGIELAEHIHAADSDAVLDALSMLEGDDGAQARWKLSLYAPHRLAPRSNGAVRDRRSDFSSAMIETV